MVNMIFKILNEKWLCISRFVILDLVKCKVLGEDLIYIGWNKNLKDIFVKCIGSEVFS